MELLRVSIGFLQLAHAIEPSVTLDEGYAHAWPATRRQILDADILVIGTPPRSGEHSSAGNRTMECADAFLEKKDDKGRWFLRPGHCLLWG